MQMIGRVALLSCLLMTAACTTRNGGVKKPTPGPATDPVTTLVSYACDHGSAKFLSVESSKFAKKCMAPRGEEDDFVRIPFSVAEFGSKCAVTLSLVDPIDPGHVCEPNDPNRQPFVRGDRVAVTDWGNGAFTLTRLRDNLIVALKLGDPSEGGIPFLYGTHSDITYAVYIHYTKVDQEKFQKVYRIETFDKHSLNWAECSKHMPTHSPTIVECKGHSTISGSESSTSTGGEPPPR